MSDGKENGKPETPKDLSEMTSAEIMAMVKARDETHRTSQNALRALARAKDALAAE